MASDDTTTRDVAIVAALAAGVSYDAIAKTHRVSKRTLVRWMADPQFRADVRRARGADGRGDRSACRGGRRNGARSREAAWSGEERGRSARRGSHHARAARRGEGVDRPRGDPRAPRCTGSEGNDAMTRERDGEAQAGCPMCAGIDAVRYDARSDTRPAPFCAACGRYVAVQLVDHHGRAAWEGWTP